jgi:glycosyltransferase involved in cell wall biosynthesis
MKILMFTPYVPYPPNSGGQTRTFNLIKKLSEKHEITSFCFLRTDQSEPDLTELKKYCSKVSIVRRKKAWAAPDKIFLTAFSPFPYLANMYTYASVKKEIDKELSTKKYDLIHVETYYIMPNLPKTSVPVLLAEQTIEYLVYQHYTETTKWWPLKPLLYLDVFKHRFWEAFFWKKAKKVVAMSQDDKEKMLELVPELDVDIVPNGVDLVFFGNKVDTPLKTNPTLLFVGNFNWLQNREAVDILITRIWPKIKDELPKAKLWIVGRSPTESLVALAKNSRDVLVSGDIDDIRIAYQGSDLLIAPIYGGGGTRYKILEAMASGLPVVSTQIGIEGLDVKNGIHALVDNAYEKLALFSIELIKDKILAREISTNALELVKNNYNWQSISIHLEKIYEETAKKR